MALEHIIRDIPSDRPVLIAGPTAAGKSSLALAIAAAQGGVIVNADALQVYENWRVLTARPSPEEEARAPHALYGHLAGDQAYSAGAWLREVRPFLDTGFDTGPRPIIVGGTGLNFTALTQGLAEIPLTPPEIRAAGMDLLAGAGLNEMLAQLDPETRTRIDVQNPARVARAWEVFKNTGRGLASWQDATPPPILPLENCTALVLNGERDWLRDRIARRFDIMLDQGALDEAKANLANWDPAAPSAKAIGARELIAYLQGDTDLEQAKARAILASQQYAKRQRSWFRARMRQWHQITLPI